MALFSFRIIDKHEKITFDEYGNPIATPYGEWLPFNFAIETAEIVIVSFRSYILFDENDYPVNVTKVFLSDGSFVFAATKYETFEKNYLEKYIPLFAIKTEDD